MNLMSVANVKQSKLQDVAIDKRGNSYVIGTIFAGMKEGNQSDCPFFDITAQAEAFLVGEQVCFSIPTTNQYT